MWTLEEAPIMISRLSSFIAVSVAFLPMAGAAADPGIAASPRPDAVQALRATPVTSRVSVATDGTEGDDLSMDAAISAGGRYVAFVSAASNLVAGDTNHRSDVFVRDRVARVTERVSVGLAGVQANGRSTTPAISADGRYVAFMSSGRNLVAGDTNYRPDVFVRDMVNHVTRRVSVGPGGAQANGRSSQPSISADGRYVAFGSNATDLVAGDTNGANDVFMRDTVAHVTRRVSVGRHGAQTADRKNSLNPSISADGRYVAFISRAANLVASDTNHNFDVFVRDMVNHLTRRVSVGRDGTQGNGRSRSPSISADGRYVAFVSASNNLVAGDTGAYDVFVRDTVNHVTRRVSVGPGGAQPNGRSSRPSISANGRYVAFDSTARNLVAGDTNDRFDVFVRDTVNHVTRRVSVGAGAAQANGNGWWAAISANGRYVAFQSAARNLVAGDTNGAEDVFARGPLR
jgi:Tol biopolymer transport system component